MTRFNSGLPKDVYLGNFNFYGTSTVGAVVVEHNANLQLYTCNLYVVTDANNSLLGWLPLLHNYMCFGDGSQYVEVISVNQQASTLDASCSALSAVTMTPLVYAGNSLVLMLRGGGDHVHGGAQGADVIYGGAANDDLDTEGDTALSPANVYDVAFGEEGGDFLYGSHGDATTLDGGIGNDQLYDAGGMYEYLSGGDGNDCCIGDSNHLFSVMSGGLGDDTCDRLAGATTCEHQDSQCDIPGWLHCP